MKLLDTSVFVYAHGRLHLYREPCRPLLNQVEGSPADFSVDTELLPEILHVYTSRGGGAKAFLVFDAVVEMFPGAIPVTVPIVESARRILQRTLTLSARDAVHAAIVQEAGLEGLVTTDRSFSQVPGLRVWNPSDLI